MQAVYKLYIRSSSWLTLQKTSVYSTVIINSAVCSASRQLCRAAFSERCEPSAMTELIKEQIFSANTEYIRNRSIHTKPSPKFSILTCMDSRMDPVKFAGLGENAFVVRNAGGRATEDAVRSLSISYKLLGSREWFVIHHTDCGMGHISELSLSRLFENSLEPAVQTGHDWKNTQEEGESYQGHAMRFYTFSDPVESLIEDIRILRSHPLVSSHIPIYGCLYDIETGKLSEIKEASRAGAPR